ncbi:MAG: MraY family glycosyltransferase [Solirubrobacterales bacterium]
MPDELRLGLALVSALAVTAAATPLARHIAQRTEFLDHPAGYKRHAHPIPYLGGAAVVTGFIVAAAAFGSGAQSRWLLIGSVALLCLVGTIDDRSGLPIGPRLASQIAVAVALWASGSGWDLLVAEPVNLAVTAIWVVGIANAVNLLDNLDGAAGTVGGTSALGIAILAIVEGEVGIAAIALALAGACAGFLPFNVSRPPSIFLGDGGSVSIGLVLAFATMAIEPGQLGWVSLLASVPLVGVLIFDTTLVVVSRYKRRLPILQGGRDHVTHRLLTGVGSPQKVCLVLGLTQALLSGLAIALHQLSAAQASAAAIAYCALGALTLVLFERPGTTRVAAEKTP